MKALSCTWLLPLLSQNSVLGTLSMADTRIGLTSEFGNDGITPGRTAAEHLKSWQCFWASMLSFQMLLDSAGAYWNCGRSGVIPYQNTQRWDHLEDLAGETIQGEGKNSSSKTNFRSVFAHILKFALQKKLVFLMRNDCSPVGSYPSTDLSMEVHQTRQENLVSPNGIIKTWSLQHLKDPWLDALYWVPCLERWGSEKGNCIFLRMYWFGDVMSIS